MLTSFELGLIKNSNNSKPGAVSGVDGELRWLHLPSRPKGSGGIFRFYKEIHFITGHLLVQHFHLVVGVVGVVKNGKDIANCEDHCGKPGGPKGEVC